MKSINVQFKTILSTLLFTAIFFGVGYFLISLIPHTVYQIIISLLLVILYINLLKFFIFELMSLKDTRASEMLNYFFMYTVTVGVVVFPFFLEPVYVFEAPYVRILIIIFASILLLKYFLYMILGPLSDIFHKINHYCFYEDKKYNPLLSVMIPAWNEEVGIIHTIKSVLSSEYRNFEIVIVNDGSTDNSDALIKSFIKKYDGDINIQYQYQKNGGKGSALNRAVGMAKGDILVSIDADCLINKGALGAFVEEFKNPKVMAAVGNVKIGNRNSTVGMVQYLEFLFSFYFKRAESLLGTIYIIGGASGAFRKKVFDKVGLYSITNITEDIELTVRIQDAGMKISFVPGAVVYTEGASDLQSLKKQRLRWKRGRFQTFYQHWYLFFSTKKRHNKFLTFFVMPMAVFSEIQLLLEIPFLIFLYTFSILNSDFTALFIGVIVVGTMFVVQFMFYDKSTRRLSFVALAPIGWLLFYIATYVEAYALVKSLVLFISRKEVLWQKWDRKGILVHSNS